MLQKLVSSIQVPFVGCQSFGNFPLKNQKPTEHTTWLSRSKTYWKPDEKVRDENTHWRVVIVVAPVLGLEVRLAHRREDQARDDEVGRVLPKNVNGHLRRRLGIDFLHWKLQQAQRKGANFVGAVR